MSVMHLLRGRHLRKGDEVVLTTVSGVASTKPALIRYFDQKVPSIGIITTKSFQVEVNPGNCEPIICETSWGNFGNSVGLRNPGLKVALAELEQLRKDHTFRSLINVSLSANSIEDFIILVKAFDEVADMVELNFSCPHASVGYGSTIGCDQGIASEYVRAIKKATGGCKAPLFVKLTPNTDDIGSIARAVVLAGADGLVAINTVGPIQHIDPVAGLPILQNKLSGKGGCSGKWVHEEALRSVSEVRKAVGPSVPLIGMGGVTTGFEAAAMIEAGADAVGIGSAFGMVDQRNWPSYIARVQAEAQALLQGKKPAVEPGSSSFLISERQMAYTQHTVTKIEQYGKDTSIITLDGSLPCKAGEFAFLWLPLLGEKPFSVAHNDPLTFIVKNRGQFSSELCQLGQGSKLYVRGLYGAPLENVKTAKALLVAGGTGVAVLPSLVEQLKDQNTALTILVGTSEAVTGKALLEERLGSYGSFTCIADDGMPGRVLGLLDSIELESDQGCYLVGPEKFMEIAARKLISRGIREDLLYLSMEKLTLCGIGMCGECACGDRLTCRWGTFMRYDYLAENAPQMVGL
ncbi:MAG: dihydroorotate dehydrogenase [Spirochaetia bacterium]|nr:dihydroorotate dehydrogenase [Spirochaetia bacterium]